jgi:hypothetical protein
MAPESGRLVRAGRAPGVRSLPVPTRPPRCLLFVVLGALLLLGCLPTLASARTHDPNYSPVYGSLECEYNALHNTNTIMPLRRRLRGWRSVKFRTEHFLVDTNDNAGSVDDCNAYGTSTTTIQTEVDASKPDDKHRKVIRGQRIFIAHNEEATRDITADLGIKYTCMPDLPHEKYVRALTFIIHIDTDFGPDPAHRRHRHRDVGMLGADFEEC